MIESLYTFISDEREVYDVIKMKTKMLMTLLVVGLLAVGSIFTFGMATAQNEDGQWKVKKEEGTTEKFGGGHYRYFKFSNGSGDHDAMFGVIWGNEDTPNSIVMVSTQARYLAQVQVRMQDSHGGQGGHGQHDGQRSQVQERQFVKMNSMLATSIGRIYEYNDSNENGVVNLQMNEDGSISSELEDVYKYVDLRNATWSSSEVTKTQKGDNTTWEFTLTAEDLPYKPVGESLSPGMEQEVLEYVNFTFHLTAGTREVDGAKMPSFDVEVREGSGGRMRMREADRNGTAKVSGLVGDFSMKWDHEFQGWDFEEENQNPRLVMGFRNMFGNQIPTEEHRWHWRFMHQKQEREGAHFRDQQGEHSTNFSEPTQFRERQLKQNRINYGGEWSRAGMFRWQSNVSIEGKQDKMTAQLIFGAPMMHSGPMGRDFVGFQVWGGLNYPGGQNIYHDPAQSGSAFLQISENSGEIDGSLLTPLMGKVLVITISGLAIVAGVLLYRKRGNDGPKNRYDKKEPSEEENWSDYYDRER